VPETTEKNIKHLLRRAGFGASQADFEYYMDLGLEGTVAELVNPATVSDSPLDARINANQYDLVDAPWQDYSARWLCRMTYTKRPLQEKLALFLHDHFATNLDKVGYWTLMEDQIDLFRNFLHGQSNFKTLVRNVSRGEAMLLYLDNYQNFNGHVQENFARELCELHTIGIGNYTQTDIVEAARALTGWSLRWDDDSGIPYFWYYTEEWAHDAGQKTFLGRTGNWDGDDIINILMGRMNTRKHIVKKLWEWFAYDNPSQTVINQLQAIFRDSGLKLRPVLQQMFMMDQFYSANAYRRKIKSPVEWLVGAMRQLEVESDCRDEVWILHGLGHAIYYPPNPSGWDGGRTWLNANTIFARSDQSGRFAHPDWGWGPAIDPIAFCQKYNIKTTTQIVNFFSKLLLDNTYPLPLKARMRGYMNTNHDGNQQTFSWSAEDWYKESKIGGLIFLLLSSQHYQMA
jgi:uncharacterized protein (DUF1800 family)